jgi:FkbM family methyltransferase
VNFQNSLVVKFVRSGYFSNSEKRLTRLGSGYGGWLIPDELLTSQTRRVLISLGIGFDVSFDEELCLAGFEIVAVDPLLECIQFAKDRLSKFENCYFENVGVSDFEGMELFFSPKNLAHDSWSSVNIHGSSLESARGFPVTAIKNLLAKYRVGQVGETTYLKMDVEGAELKLIPEIVNLETTFDFLGIELDFLSLIPFFSIKRRWSACKVARFHMRNLEKRGYSLVHTDNFNFFWNGPVKI